MPQRAADWLEANPGRDTALPDMTWSGDRKDIDMGDFTVKMHYLGLNVVQSSGRMLWQCL